MLRIDDSKFSCNTIPSWLENSSSPAKIVPGKGQYYSLCFLDFNIDLESNTCSVTIDGEGKTNLKNACTYCYSKYNFKKTAKFKKKIVKESVFKNLKKKLPEFSVLRIGKNVECGSPHTRSELYQVLELCLKYNIRPIVTSKVLEYDEHVAQLVKDTNGVVHISLGRDEMEPGAVQLGFDNKTRFENAKKYKNFGCVTACRVVEDITLPMPEFIKTVYESGMDILLTPLHYPDKVSFSLRRNDLSWEEAKEKKVFEFSHGALRPMEIHQDWNKTKERCGLVMGREYCNNCNLGRVKFSEEVGSNKKSYQEKVKKWNQGLL